jgi:uncharacterized protein (DUF305 family)
MKTLLLVPAITFLIISSCSDAPDKKLESDANSATQNSSRDEAATSDRQTSKQNTTQDMPFMSSMNKMMQDMMSLKMTEDPDHDFAMMMKRHHEGAIEMSNIELQQGKNQELKQVAQKIVDDSKKDIAELESFMSSHKPSEKSDFAKQSMKMMHKTDLEHSADIDQQFASTMTKHHRDGIEIAKLYLKFASQEQTKTVARRSIKANGDDLKKLEKFSADGKPSSHKAH